MAKTRRSARFAQKAKPGRFITKILVVDDFQRHRTSKIDVERFVGDSHGTATQLDRFPLFVENQFIMLESARYAGGCYLSVAWFRRRFVGLGLLFEGLAKHAHRTEFRCSGKLITATGADASVPRCQTMVAFHEEMGLSSTVSGKRLFRNENS